MVLKVFPRPTHQMPLLSGLCAEWWCITESLILPRLALLWYSFPRKSCDWRENRNQGISHLSGRGIWSLDAARNHSYRLFLGYQLRVSSLVGLCAYNSIPVVHLMFHEWSCPNVMQVGSLNVTRTHKRRGCSLAPRLVQSSTKDPSHTKLILERCIIYTFVISRCVEQSNI
jgi:hypothetical protein